MKKIVISISVLLITAMALAPMASAQQRIYFVNIGPVVAFPTGNFNKAANAGVGVTGSFVYEYSPQVDFLANVGWIKWGGKTNSVDFSAVPIQVGAKYYLSTNVNRFYVGGLMGLHLVRISNSTTVPGSGLITKRTDNETDFSIAPMAGYQVD